MMDKLLGRKTRFNWGKNSKREIRYIEKKQTQLDIFEELEDEKEDARQAKLEQDYQEYLENHWLNQLITSRRAAR